MPVDNFYALTTSDALDLLKLTSGSTRHQAIYGEVLHAGWTGLQSKLTVPLSAPFLDKVKQARQIARIAIFALLLSAGYLSWQILALQGSTLTLKNTVQEQQAKTGKLQIQLDEMTRKMGTLEQEPEKTKVALATYEEYSTRHLDAEPTLKILVETLSAEGLLLKDLDIEIDASAAPRLWLSQHLLQQ